MAADRGHKGQCVLYVISDQSPCDHEVGALDQKGPISANIQVIGVACRHGDGRSRNTALVSKLSAAQ